MLEGRGMDFEAMGLAMGYRRSIEAAQCEIDTAYDLVRRERATRAAAIAGRMAQIWALVDALHDLDPEHPLLAETGLTWADGERQRAWQAPYDDAYDTVALANGISRVPRAMRPADLAEAKVLGEPIEMRRVLIFFRQPFFRGVEYTSIEGAQRARAKAALAAREGVEG